MSRQFCRGWPPPSLVGWAVVLVCLVASGAQSAPSVVDDQYERPQDGRPIYLNPLVNDKASADLPAPGVCRETVTHSIQTTAVPTSSKAGAYFRDVAPALGVDVLSQDSTQYVEGQCPHYYLTEDFERTMDNYEKYTKWEESPLYEEGMTFEEYFAKMTQGTILRQGSNDCSPMYNAAGGATADFDGDGFQDLVVPRVGAGPKLFLNRRDGTFEDATHRFPADVQWSTTGVGVGDVDNDGDVDVSID